MKELNAARGQRILVYTPYGRDADHLCRVLGDEGYDCAPCRDLHSVVTHLRDPSSIGAILSTEEALAAETLAFTESAGRAAHMVGHSDLGFLQSKYVDGLVSKESLASPSQLYRR